MSGVVICPIHEQVLFTTDVPQHPSSKFSFVPAEKLEITGLINVPEAQAFRLKLLQLSRNFFELLNSSRTYNINFHQFSTFYYQLAELNSLVKGHRVNHAAIAEKLTNYWTIDGLKKLDPSLAPVDKWLRLLFLKQRKAFHPLHHLLVWQSFDESRPTTILEKISKLSDIEVTKSNPVVEIPSKQHQQERQKWLNNCHQNPQKGIKWLRLIGDAGGNYMWLYRHDRNWLQTHSPARLKSNQNHNRIDWSARDFQVLNMLIKLRTETNIELLDTRMTTAWFIKNIDANFNIDKHFKNLYQSKIFIDEHSETVEQFQRRRILATITDLRLKNISLSLWNILRRAGIRKNFVDENMINFIKNNQGNI